MKSKLAALLLVGALSVWAAAQTQSATESRDEARSGIHDTVDIIGQPQVAVHGNTATLNWQTNKTAADRVRYGTNPNNLTQHAYEPGGSRNHSVTLANLHPNHTYYYAIENRNGQVRYNGQFSTAGTSASAALPQSDQPVNASSLTFTNGPNIESVGRDTAVIDWSTNVPANAVVRYGTTPNNLNQNAMAPWSAGTHRVTITNLRPGTKYWFMAFSGAAQGTGAQHAGPLQSLTTKP